MNQPDKNKYRALEGLTTSCVRAAGSPWALEIVLSFFTIWLVMGTTSAAVTLVMVFLLVRAQAKDTLSIQVKLNEVIGALQGANNQLISIENMSADSIIEIGKRYEAIAIKLSDENTVSTHEIIAE